MTLLDRALCRPCIFCEIVNGNVPNKLIYKDDEIAAFEDINPAAETHILIVPVAHIRNIKSLTTEHSSLLEKMRLKGVDLLQDRGYEPQSSK
ncbi:hypothetical protein BGZ98_002246 [Dissophora globulifera]|nr:hypothetical protein BGZ98_002246 [Dissophora globulifera]